MALQRLLTGALGPEHLHLSCRAEALTETRTGMRVRCSSGAVFEASVVVGADGVHSVARNWVTGGDEPVYSGTSGFRGLVPAERLPSLPDPGALQFWMGPGAHLLHYPIQGGSVINFLAVIDGPERWTAPAWMEPAEPGAHLEAFTGWHPAVTEMLTAVPQSPRWGLFARRPLARWSRGPVVLLGDAAHAMLPHQGQGANQTIEDAAVLAAELTRCRTRPCRRRARRVAPLPGPPPGTDAPGPADVVGGIRRAAPARRPGRTAPRRGPGPPPRRPGLDPRLRRARARYLSGCAMLGGGGIAEPASAVLGGGGTAEQDASAVAGGGGIAEQDESVVFGGGGTAEQDASAVAGGGGIAEQDESVVFGGGGIAEQDESVVFGGGGIAEQDSAVLGGGGILDPERAGLSALATPFCPDSIFQYCAAIALPARLPSHPRLRPRPTQPRPVS